MTDGPGPAASAAQVALTGLAVSDIPERWRALGFAVDEDGGFTAGAVRVTLGIAPPGRGIVGWTLHGQLPGVTTDVVGLPTQILAAAPAPVPAAVHPNGTLAIDHVVILTPDFDGTAIQLAQAGLGLRRTARRDGRRQGFRRLGGPIMEIVEAPEAPAVRFWGVTFTVARLSTVTDRAPRVGPDRAAVQPGRRIAAVTREAGLSTRVAFMDPER